MTKTISEVIRDIMGNSKNTEQPDMIFTSREEAERIAQILGVRLEDLDLQFMNNKTKQNISEG
jgi:hypothetical protein